MAHGAGRLCNPLALQLHDEDTSIAPRLDIAATARCHPPSLYPTLILVITVSGLS